MTYMATSLHKNPCPGGHEIYNFGFVYLNRMYTDPVLPYSIVLQVFILTKFTFQVIVHIFVQKI